MVRQEEPSQYSSQYSQHFENHYHDIPQTTISTPGFQNYQAPVPPRAPLVHQQDPTTISSYAPDGRFSFGANDEIPGRDIGAAFSHHQGSTSSSVNQQEVPSSYSSVPGKEGLEGQQHGYSLLAADSRSVPLEQAQFTHGNHSFDPMDQPLEFTPRFGHENNLKVKSSYPDSLGPTIGTDSVAPVSSLHAWTASVAPNVSYPPITPAFPSASQHESSIGIPPLAGQSAPMFGRGSGFQPAVPSIGSPIGLGAGSALHPSAAFPVDAYGASLGTERPKKAAVPNWLREEIIKNKAAITNSTPEQFKEGIQSMKDDSIDNPIGKSDQADSKSIDSSRSMEEDDDEDYEVAQRTAAINQEVKRIVTEVLLTVTDELFDEIATRVLSEDDLTTDVIPSPDNLNSNHQVSPPPTVPASNSSAKVLVPVKAKESETENASGESSSGSPGNVLGLVNYASDDEYDNQNQISSVPKSDSSGGQNVHPRFEAEEHHKSPVNAEGDLFNGKSTGAQSDHVAMDLRSNDHRMNGKDLDNGAGHQPYSRTSVAKKGDSVADDGKSLLKSDAKSRDNSGKTTSGRADLPTEKHSLRKTSEDSQERDTRGHDRHDIRRISSGRHIMKKTEGSMEREGEEEEIHGRRDGRHQKKDNIEDHNVSKDRLRDQGGKHREKTRESDSRKRSPLCDVKDDKKERERDKKRGGRDEDKKRERAKDEKGDKSRHKSSDESRHKRRHSSPIGKSAKPNKESPLLSGDSSDEAAEDSRSKFRSKRRDLSPSPSRARRRQVSRSPSKHTQRRHSPYPSLDGSRGRRSRSRSPVRRRR